VTSAIPRRRFRFAEEQGGSIMPEIHLTHQRLHALDSPSDHSVAGLSGVVKIGAGQVVGGAAHGDLAGITTDQHHAEVHALAGTDHTASGLTTGNALVATGTTTFAWGQVDHVNLANIGTKTHAQIDTHIAATGTSVHGLGSLSTQAANAVAITGGAVNGLTGLGVGVTAYTGYIMVTTNTGTANFQALAYGSTANGGGFFRLSYGRGTSSVPLVVANGDRLGVLDFQGFDGTSWQGPALVECRVDGTPGAGVMPARVAVYTAPSGSATPVERLRVNAAGSLLLGTTTDGMTASGSLAIAQDLAHRGTKAGFFNTAPASKPTVTGSRGGNAALASLLTALAGLGLLTDSTTA
jgi:hypothetical protein